MHPLRDYQERAVREALSYTEPTCIVLPTGGGKTRLSMAILNEVPGPGLFVVHRRELVIQSDAVLREYGLRDRIEPCTVQGLLASGRRPPCNILILDEHHHYVADEFRTIQEHYANARCYGLTATPERSDGRPLGDIAKHLVVAAHYSELLKNGHLVPCRVIRPDERLDRGLAQDPVTAYLEHCEGGSGFVFAPRIEEAEKLAARFTEAGVPAMCVSDETPTEDRDQAIGKLKSGELKLLTNCACLGEGVDIPSASVCILARNFGHISPWLQAVGRVLRPYPGKTHAILLDLPGLSHCYGSPLDDRVYSLTGAGISRASDPITQCLNCGFSYESGPEACPNCSFVAPSPKWKPLKIYSVELREAYAGKATDEDVKRNEYLRLRKVAKEKGWSIEFVVKSYRQLFGTAPVLFDVTEEEKRAQYYRFLAIAKERGYKVGFAAVRYKTLFNGAWPSRQWGSGNFR